MPIAVHLTGDHLSLARAELEAVAGPVQWLGDRVGLVDVSVERIAKLGFLREALRFVAHAPDQTGAIDALAPLLLHGAPSGSKAIATLRTGSPKSAHGGHLKRTWGTALAAAHTIDLAAPDDVLAAWLHEGRITAGWRLAEGATDHQDRGVEHRDHFSPVSLPPRIARALVHLAQAPGGLIYDPFCGTGGIVLEAALTGHRVLASDLDAWMVQGTLGTLADAGPEALDGDAFVADIGDVPGLVGVVDGIVTDLPYGSASTTNQEALASLYDRAFASFAAVLAPGSRAVIGHADPALLEPIAKHGFVMEQVHEHFVHKSLTRRYAVVKRVGPVA